MIKYDFSFLVEKEGGGVKIFMFMIYKSIKDSGLANLGHSNGKFIVQGRITSSTLHQFCFVVPLWLNNLLKEMRAQDSQRLVHSRCKIVTRKNTILVLVANILS